MNLIKVKFYTYIQNAGDGSCCALFFKTKESAEQYASLDYERFCDDINFKELEFDLDGNFLGEEPIHYKVELGIV